ncbi:MAG: acyl-CoA dehydratase activase [Peptococcaceae bacterium]|nr:acyl-CoA dehydratase activase [Peptococcaceae bacterium]
MTNYFLGVDVGSVSTNVVAMDVQKHLCAKVYLRTGGRPLEALIDGVHAIQKTLGPNSRIAGAGATGSGRLLAGCVLGADVVKNEITAHAVASLETDPSVRTVLEIGGQDSKIIFLNQGTVVDFAMNTVCAAGTGSFLDRQAARLNIPIEKMGSCALRSQQPVRIAGRCAVFAESDMIHKQQMGHPLPDIVRGLCEAIVRNYLNNLAKGKKIEPTVVFQGGVAANAGIVEEFKRQLGCDIVVPRYYDVMGAFGASLLAHGIAEQTSSHTTSFVGFDQLNRDYSARSVECDDCANACEVIELRANKTLVSCWGDRCGKWSAILARGEEPQLFQETLLNKTIEAPDPPQVLP